MPSAPMGQMQGRKIGYRTYRSLRERHSQGHSAGGRIYGYTSVEDGNYRKRVKVEAQCKVVLEIFERYARGESAYSIVRLLNERGVPCPGSFWKGRKRRSDGWSATSIVGAYNKASGILRNPIYSGRVTWNKTSKKRVPGTSRKVQNRRPQDQWIENYDKSLRIVSDDIWNVVQSRLQSERAKREGIHKMGRRSSYLLSGLLKCECCGYNYVMSNKVNYQCSSQKAKRANCTQSQVIRRSDVERDLLAGIKRQLLDPQLIRAMASSVRAEVRKAARSGVDPIKRARKLDKQIDAVTATICDVGHSDALSAKLMELESEKRSLPQKRSSVPLITGVEELVASMVENLENLRDFAVQDEVEQAGEALRQIIGEVIVSEDAQGISLIPKLTPYTGEKSGAQKKT